MQQTGHRRFLAGALALACATITSCTAGSTQGSNAAAEAAGSASAGSPGSTYLPGVHFEYGEGRQESKAMDQVVLPIAPCALHDPRAAEKVTGLTAQTLEPGEAMTACDLNLEGESGDKGWDFGITVGDRLSGDIGKDAKPLSVGGLRVYRQLGSTGSCYFIYKFHNNFTIRLSVYFSGLQDKKYKDKACAVGKKYLGKVTKYWKDPPQRAAGVTRPRLMLGLQSPCESAKKVMQILPDPEGTTKSFVSRYNPSACTVGVKVGSGFEAEHKDQATVSFQVSDPPEKRKGQEGVTLTKIAGQPAAVEPSTSGIGSDTCRVTVRYSKERISLDLERPGERLLSQNVVASAASCGAAKKVAKAAIRAARS